MTATNPWQTRAARGLRARVLREEPVCRIKLPGCTAVSTVVDHIIPQSQRPDLILVRSNLQGACDHCNRKRSNAPLDALKPAPALSYFTNTPTAQQHSTGAR